MMIFIILINILNIFFFLNDSPLNQNSNTNIANLTRKMLTRGFKDMY